MFYSQRDADKAAEAIEGLLKGAALGGLAIIGCGILFFLAGITALGLTVYFLVK